MHQATVTERIVATLNRRAPAARRPEAMALARYFTLDLLGALLAGHGTDTGRKFQAYAAGLPEGVSPLIGLGRSGSVESAAFVNGALAHIVEMDDVARQAIIHPGTVVIPAAMAVAAEVRSTGPDLLAAIIAGYEVAMLVGEAVGPEHYYHFHNTATCGVFGAATAAGWLLRLTPEQQVWALGNAGTQAFGLWQFNAEGALSKPLHSGRAAANGVLAALLARQGISGATRILEGERGFFAGLAPKGDLDRLTRALADEAPSFRIAGVSIKPHASCRHTHAPIDAALRLREQLGEQVTEVTRTTVRLYRAGLDLCDNPTPASAAEAKFSLQYCVASALLRGRVGLADFDDLARADAAVQKLTSAGGVAHDATCEARYPACWSAVVEVSLTDGRNLSQAVGNPKGDPENPLTYEELQTKFDELAAYGGLTARETRDCRDWVRGLADDGVVDWTLLSGLKLQG